MSKIRTKKMEDNTYNLYTPYNRDFVSRIKGIGGTKWDASARAWNIPAAGIGTAREIMTEVYGENDLPGETKMVTLRVYFDNECSEYRSGITAFGKTLAYAFGRDSGAKVGDDVILERGKIKSGGSCKNWYTTICAGSVFRITVPESIYFRDRDDWHVELVAESESSKRQALIEEREKLLARLAEIEKELNEGGNSDDF